MLTKETILNLMATDLSFLEKCIVTIYEKQTEDEQINKSATHTNGIGFNQANSIRGCWYAQHILRGNSQYRKVYGQNLTGDHILKARKFMAKYAGQLVKFQDSIIAKGEIKLAA
jgi:hypothetical protein